MGGDATLIVKGPALIPNIPDKAGDVLSEEDVRKAAIIIARNGILIDIQHTLRNIGKPLELYVLDDPTQWKGNMLPKGTLMISVDIVDEDIKEAVRKGLYTGFSITAAPTRTVEEMDRGLNQ